MRSPDFAGGGERDETGCVEYRQPDCQRHQNDVYFAERTVDAPLPGAIGPFVSKRGKLHFARISPAREALNKNKLQRDQTDCTDIGQPNSLTPRARQFTDPPMLDPSVLPTVISSPANCRDREERLRRTCSSRATSNSLARLRSATRSASLLIPRAGAAKAGGKRVTPLDRIKAAISAS